MAMEITNNYNSIYESTYRTQNNSGTTMSNGDYLKKLEKLAPSVELRIGITFSKAGSGKTLTINPALLNKMRNDPEQEKETMELIKGVEFITKFMDGIYKASGKKLVFHHSYIDENGKYRAYSRVVSDDRLSKKLREERRKNTVKLIEKTRQKAAKRKKERPAVGRNLDLKV